MLRYGKEHETQRHRETERERERERETETESERNNKYVCAWCTRVYCLYVVKRNVLSVCMLLCAICFRSFDELVRPRRTCLRDKMRDAAAMHCSALLLQLSAGGISFYEGIVFFRSRKREALASLHVYLSKAPWKLVDTM